MVKIAKNKDFKKTEVQKIGSNFKINHCLYPKKAVIFIRCFKSI
jgi:hypothetical protein